MKDLEAFFCHLANILLLSIFRYGKIYKIFDSQSVLATVLKSVRNNQIYDTTG